MIAVCSGAWGDEAEALSRVTFPAIEDYARRCGAKFEVLPPRADLPPMYGKFGVRDLLGVYERVLWLDADCLVRPDCPDLFALVPPGRWAGFDELERADDLDVFNHHQDIVRVCGSDGLPVPETGGRYFNAGVHLAPSRLRWLYDDPPTRDEHDWAEQSRINANLFLAGEDVFHLPECFNTRAYVRPPRRWEMSAFVAHFAGPPPGTDRLRAITALARRWGLRGGGV